MKTWTKNSIVAQLASCASLLLMLPCVLPAAAQVPETASYNCAVGETAQQALDAVATGHGSVKASISGGELEISSQGIKARIGAPGSSDGEFLKEAGPFFDGLPAHMITGPNNLSLGRVAFGHDASGSATAYMSLYGIYQVACVDAGQTAANFASAPQQIEPHVEEPKEDLSKLTDEEKDERLFNQPVEQRGQERTLLGLVSFAQPSEGHYQCTRANYYSDETKKSPQIDSDDDHTGFDLFKDGSYRLKKKDGTFEQDGSTWRHNPANGTVFFDEGTLEIYFKWPIHVRKVLEPSVPETSLLYKADYDSDGAIDDMTMCINVGPPQSKSPKVEIAEISAKNLKPPPAGTTVKVPGLYYNQRWVPMMGFGNPPTMYQEDYYDYRYFQANGYVWLSDPPDDGDFEKLGCNKPMVDKEGEPLCTTYDIQDGLLSAAKVRIGHDAPVPFEQGDDTVSVDGTSYSLVPPQTDLKIEKFVRYFSYNGMASREGSITFRANGTYESTSWSGVNFTSEIPDVARTTVVSSNPGEDLKGTYRIEGHTITFTSGSGKISKTFFGRLGDGFFMVGGQPYFEPTD